MISLVHVDELHPGDVLDKPIYAKNGLIMLEAGTELTEKYIVRLQNLGFQKVALGKRSAAAEAMLAARAFSRVEDTIRDTAEIDLLKSNSAQLQETHHSLIHFLESEDSFERLALPLAEQAKFRRDFRDRIMEAVSHRAVAEELSVLRQSDPLLFGHSMQVSLLSGVVGTAGGLDPNNLYELTVGSLLFDIGMTRISQSLLRSTAKLTETEVAAIRQHTTLGHRVLSQMKEVPDAAAKCALLHHERYRGEGYPYGLQQNKIPEMAQIVGLADVFDALISPRHHRDPFPAYEAMEYLFAAGNYDFGASHVKTFLKHISVFPVSTPVMLSSGQIGIVRHTEGRQAHRPVVQIVREADGRVPSPYMLDLSEDHNIMIIRSIKDQ